jgi:cytochrome c oxidase cbb3-type subunit 2
MNKLVLIAGGSALIYAGLALLMGVLPGIELSKTRAGTNVQPLNTLEAEGRDIYVANGCSYCHTQQVRPLEQDKRFGRPSAPGDFAYQTPELLGSERTGPDLTNIGIRQSNEVWQRIHLYNPRAVVPESIMPAYDWMFQVVDQMTPGAAAVPLPKAYAPSRGRVEPTHQVDALVAYLLSLKQPPLAQGATAVDTATRDVNEAAMAESTATVNVASGTVAAAGGYDAIRGSALFTSNCAVCHQANGEGLPGAFPPLKGDAAVNDGDAIKQIHVVLNGLQGGTVGGVVYTSAMPPFAATLSDADVANIIDYERRSWGNHGAPVGPGQVANERAKGK